MDKAILIFSSVHHTMKAEAILKNTRYNFQVVPVPPTVNEGCGLGLQVNERESEKIVSHLKSYRVEIIKTVKIIN